MGVLMPSLHPEYPFFKKGVIGSRAEDLRGLQSEVVDGRCQRESFSFSI